MFRTIATTVAAAVLSVSLASTPTPAAAGNGDVLKGALIGAILGGVAVSVLNDDNDKADRRRYKGRGYYQRRGDRYQAHLRHRRGEYRPHRHHNRHDDYHRR